MFFRASQFDMEGLTDTWDGSMSGWIPQVDGAGDAKSDDASFTRRPTRSSLQTKSRFTRLLSLEEENRTLGRLSGSHVTCPESKEVGAVDSGETLVTTSGSSSGSVFGTESRKGVLCGAPRKEEISDEEMKVASPLSDNKYSWRKGYEYSKKTDIFPGRPKALFTYSSKKRPSGRIPEKEDSSSSKSQGAASPCVREQSWRKSSESDDNIWPGRPMIVRTYSSSSRLAFAVSRKKQRASPSSSNICSSSERSADAVVTVNQSKRSSDVELSFRLSSSSDDSEKSSVVKTRNLKDQNKSPKRKRVKLACTGTASKSPVKQKPSPVQGRSKKEPHKAGARSKGTHAQWGQRTLRSRQLPLVSFTEKISGSTNKQQIKVGQVETRQGQTFRVLPTITTRKGVPVYSGLKDVIIELTDANFIHALKDRLHEAKSRLTKQKEKTLKRFTKVNQRKKQNITKSSTGKQQRLSLRSKTSTSSRKYTRTPQKRTPSPRQRKSPRKNSEMLKQYGTIPVLFQKSPKKSPVSSRSLKADPGSSVAQDTFPVASQPAKATSSSQDSVVVLSDSGEKSPVAYGITEIFYSPSVSRARDRLASSAGASTSTSKSRARARVASSNNRIVKRKLYTDVEQGIVFFENHPGSQKKRRLSLRLRSSTAKHDTDTEMALGSVQAFPATAGKVETIDLEEDGDVSVITHSGEHVRDKVSENKRSSREGIPSDNNNSNDNTVDVEAHERGDADNDVITCVPSSPISSDDVRDSSIEALNSPNANKASLDNFREKSSGHDEAVGSLPERDDHSNMAPENLDILDDVDISRADQWNPDLFANALFNMSRMSPANVEESEGSPPEPSSPNEQSIEDLFKIPVSRAGWKIKGDTRSHLESSVSMVTENSKTSQNGVMQHKSLVESCEDGQVNASLVASEDRQAKANIESSVVKVSLGSNDEELHIKRSVHLDEQNEALCVYKSCEKGREVLVQKGDVSEEDESSPEIQISCVEKDGDAINVRHKYLEEEEEEEEEKEEFVRCSNERMTDTEEPYIKKVDRCTDVICVSSNRSDAHNKHQSDQSEECGSTTVCVEKCVLNKDESAGGNTADMLYHTTENENSNDLLLSRSNQSPVAQSPSRETDDISQQTPLHFAGTNRPTEHQSFASSMEDHQGPVAQRPSRETDDISQQTPLHFTGTNRPTEHQSFASSMEDHHGPVAQRPSREAETDDISQQTSLHFAGTNQSTKHQSFASSMEVHHGPVAQRSSKEAETDHISTETSHHLDVDSNATSNSTALQTSTPLVVAMETDDLPPDNDVIISPLRHPPSADEVLATLKDYGLPQCRYQRPFCSNPRDIPECPR